jgi:cell division protein FtsW (lipid II flippase)
MFLRILLALVAVALFLWLLRWFVRTPPATVQRHLGRAAIVLVIGVLILLAVTGRLHWLVALGATLVALAGRAVSLLSMLPLLRKAGSFFKSGGNPAPDAGTAGQSQVESRFLRMRLDHDSGSLDGQVLEGQHAGARLSELPLADLLELLRAWRLEDEDSAQLLESYLERAHGADWRVGFAADAGQGQRDAGAGGPMTAEEAWRILGLEPGAERDAIMMAHRRLMQKLHPDRGGSDYLAARINQAKDRLLEEV